MINYLNGFGLGRKMRNNLLLICNAVLCCGVYGRRLRNQGIFKDRTDDYSSLVEEIKVVSWKWFLSKNKVNLCLLQYE
jgi:hypothetical protein